MQTCIKGDPNNEKVSSQKVIVIQENPINDVIIVPGIQKETVKVCPTITLGTFEQMKTPKLHRMIASPILQDKTNAENSYLKIVSPATTNQAVQNPGNKAKQLKVNLEDPTKLIKFTWTGSNWGVLPENWENHALQLKKLSEINIVFYVQNIYSSNKNNEAF